MLPTENLQRANCGWLAPYKDILSPAFSVPAVFLCSVCIIFLADSLSSSWWASSLLLWDFAFSNITFLSSSCSLASRLHHASAFHPCCDPLTSLLLVTHFLEHTHPLMISVVYGGSPCTEVVVWPARWHQVVGDDDITRIHHSLTSHHFYHHNFLNMKSSPTVWHCAQYGSMVHHHSRKAREAVSCNLCFCLNILFVNNAPPPPPPVQTRPHQKCTPSNSLQRTKSDINTVFYLTRMAEIN